MLHALYILAKWEAIKNENNDDELMMRVLSNTNKIAIKRIPFETYQYFGK